MTDRDATSDVDVIKKLWLDVKFGEEWLDVAIGDRSFRLRVRKKGGDMARIDIEAPPDFLFVRGNAKEKTARSRGGVRT